MAVVRSIQLTQKDFVDPETIRLTREEVPEPPYKVKGDIVQIDRHRWRFNKRGDLTVYIEYGPEENPPPNFKRFWSDGR